MRLVIRLVAAMRPPDSSKQMPPQMARMVIQTERADATIRRSASPVAIDAIPPKNMLRTASGASMPYVARIGWSVFIDHSPTGFRYKLRSEGEGGCIPIYCIALVHDGEYAFALPMIKRRAEVGLLISTRSSSQLLAR